MSNVDTRIVEMQFDNKQFEQGIQTSMKSLEAFNKQLDFKGASSSFNELESASKVVKLSALEEAGRTCDGLLQKFINVVEYKFFDKLTSQAAGLFKGLSIDQVTAGWGKYIEKTSSVQTLMNSTGKSIEEINGYLDELMWFSDETSYSFTDMTKSLAQLTSSGGDIETLIPMIEGIANATAYAGKGTTEFSRAIYNLNQSYGHGSLQYIDWKSLELAGVATADLKQVLIDAGVQLGTIREGEVTIANFGSTLKKGWATTEVMEAGFGYFAEMTQLAKEMVDSGEVQTASEAYAILAEQYDDISIKAAKSAQEAKTFNEAIVATKDAVSSQFMAIFESIFGNYVEAKKLWTDLANNLWEVFAGPIGEAAEFFKIWHDGFGEIDGEEINIGFSGRDELIGAFYDIGASIRRVLEAIQEGWEKVFPPDLLTNLYSISGAIAGVAADLRTVFGIVRDESGPELVPRAIKGFADWFIEGGQNLKKGMSGAHIKEVQEMLNEYFGEDVTAGAMGTFGNATEKAVKDFQRMNGIAETGIINLHTLMTLYHEVGKDVEWVNPNLKPVEGLTDWFTEGAKDLERGMRGDGVKKIQELLNTYFQMDVTGGTDGIFGPKTQQAVKDFQQTVGLAETGIIDLTTLVALYHELGMDYEDVTKKTSKKQPVKGLFDWFYEIGGKLEKGMSGDGVKELQRLLNLYYGGDLSLDEDGIFGDKTLKAVQRFQKEMHIFGADGSVDMLTLSLLYKQLGLDMETVNEDAASGAPSFTKMMVNISKTVAGLAAAVKILLVPVKIAFGIAKQLFVLLLPIVGVLLSITGAIGNCLSNLVLFIESSGVVETVLGAMSLLFAPLSEKINQFAHSILDFFGLSEEAEEAYGPVETFADLWDRIQKSISKSKTLSAIAGYFKAIGSAIGSVGKTIKDGFFSWLFGDSYDAKSGQLILEDETKKIIRLDDVMKAIGSKLSALKPVLTTIWNVLKAVGAAVLAVVAGIFAGISAAVNWILKSQFFAGVWDGIKSVFSTIKNAVDSATDAVLGFLGFGDKAGEGITSLSDLWNNFMGLLKNNSVLSGVVTWAENFWNTIKGFGKTIKDGIFGWLFGDSYNADTGLKMLDDGSERAANFLDIIMAIGAKLAPLKSVFTAIGKVLLLIGGLAISALGLLATGIGSLISRVQQSGIIASAFEKIGNAITSLWNRLSDWKKKIKDGIFTWLFGDLYHSKSGKIDAGGMLKSIEFSDIKKAVIGKIDKAFGISKKVSILKNALFSWLFGERYDSASGKLKTEIPGELWDIDFNAIKEAIKSKIETVFGNAKNGILSWIFGEDYDKESGKLITENGEKIITFGDVVAGIGQKIKPFTDAMAKLADTLRDSVLTWLFGGNYNTETNKIIDDDGMERAVTFNDILGGIRDKLVAFWGIIKKIGNFFKTTFYRMVFGDDYNPETGLLKSTGELATFGDALGKLKEKFKPVTDFLSRTLKPVKDGIFGWLFGSLYHSKSGKIDAGGMLKDIEFGDILSAIQDKIVGFFEKLKASIGKFIENLRAGKGLFPSLRELLFGPKKEGVGDAKDIEKTGGVFDKILDALGPVGDVLRKIIDWFKKIFANIKIDPTFAQWVIIISVIIEATRFIRSINNIASTASAVIKNAASKMTTFSKMLLSLGFTIGIIALSIYLLGSKMKPGEMWQGLGAFAIIMLILGTFIGALVVFTKMLNRGSGRSNSAQNFMNFALMMLSLSVSVLLIAHAIDYLGKMDPNVMKDGFIRLTMIVGLMAGFLIVTNLLSGKGKGLKGAFGAAMGLLIFIGALWLVAKMDFGLILAGIFKMIPIIFAWGLLMKATNKLTGGKDQWKSMLALIPTVMAFTLFAITVALIGLLPLKAILKGIFAMIPLVIGFGSLMKKTAKALKEINGKDVLIKAIALIPVVIMFVAFATAIAALGYLPMAVILKGIFFMIPLIMGFKAVIKAFNQLDWHGWFGKLLASISMAVGLVLFAAIAVGLGSFPAITLLKGVTAVAALSVLIYFMAKAFSSNKLDAKEIFKNTSAMIVAAVVVLSFAAIAMALGILPLITLAKGIGAVVLLGAFMFGLATAFSAKFIDAGSIAKNSVAMIPAALAVLAFGIVATAIGLMPLIVLAKGIGAVTLLGAFMFGLATAFSAKFINAGSILKNSLAMIPAAIAVLAFGVVATAIGLIPLVVLAKGALAVLELEALMFGMAVAFSAKFIHAGAILKNSLAMIPAALAVLAFGVVATAIGLIPLYVMQKGVLTILEMSILMTVIGVVFGSKAMNPLRLAANALAMIPLALAVLAFGAIAVAIGMIPITIMQKGILAIVELGFIMIVMAAVFGSKSINPAMLVLNAIACTVAAVAILAFGVVALLIGSLSAATILKGAGVILALTIVAAVMSVLGGAINIGGIAMASVGIIILVAVLIGIIAAVGALMNKLDENSAIFKGLKKLAKFIGEFMGTMEAAKIDAMNKSLGNMSDSNIDQSNLDNTLDAATKISDFQEKLPKKSGGQQAMDALFGSSFQSFCKDLAAFGDGIKSLSESLADVAIDQKKIDASVKAASAIKKLSDEIYKNMGQCAFSTITSFLGVNSPFATFCEDMKTFGTSMAVVAISLANVPSDLTDKVGTAVEASKQIKELWDSIYENLVGIIGETVAQLLGVDSPFTAFCNEMVSFAASMLKVGFALSIMPKDVAENAVIARTAAEEIKKLWDSIYENLVGIIGETVTQLLGVDSPFTAFCNEMVTFALSMQKVGLALSIMPKDVAGNAETARLAAEEIKKLWDSIYENLVGIVAETVTQLLGVDSPFTAFCNEMVTFALSMVKVGIALAIVPKDLSTNVENATTAAGYIKELWDGINTNITGIVAETVTQLLGVDSPFTAFCNEMVTFALSMQKVGFWLGFVPADISESVDRSTAAAQQIKTLWDGINENINGVILETITDIIGVDSPFANFCQDMQTFAMSMVRVGFWLSFVPSDLSDKTTIAVTAATKFSELWNAVNTNIVGVVATALGEWIGNGTPFSKFCGDMKTFATDITAYSDNLGDMPTDLESKTNTAVDASKKFNELYSAINTNIVGIVGTALGEWINDGSPFRSFCNDMKQFATDIKAYGNNLKGLPTNLDKDNEKAVNAATKVNELANDVPEISIGDKILGKFGVGSSFDTFVSDMSNFGAQMVTFSASMTDIATNYPNLEADTTTVLGIATAIKDFVLVLEEMDIEQNTQGISSWFGTETNTQTFIDSIGEIATKMTEFSEKVGGLSETTAAADALTVKTCLTRLAELISYVNGDEVKLTGSGENYNTDMFTKFLGNLQDFLDVLSQVSDPENFDIDQINSLSGIIESLDTEVLGSIGMFIDDLASGLNTLSEAKLSNIKTDGKNAIGPKLKAIFDSIIENIPEKLPDVSGITQVASALNTFSSVNLSAIDSDAISSKMNELGDALSQGITVNSVDTSGIASMCSTMVAKANSYKTSFTQVGEFFTMGMADGVKNKEGYLSAAVEKVVRAAIRKAKDTSQERSPSKVFAKIGGYFDLGMVNGINQYKKSVVKASGNVTAAAIDTVGDTISRIGAVLNSDVNTDPVIRPVMDLSNVTSGTNAINGMVNNLNNPTLTATASRKLAGSVALSSAKKLQNGTNGQPNAQGSSTNNAVNLSGNNFYIRSEQDIRSLASEIASFSTQQQRAYGAAVTTT